VTSPIASMKDAKAHLEKLPAELEEYLDDDYQKALARLMRDFSHFFDVVASINIKSKEEQIIAKQEATDIGEHGFILLLKLIDLMERLDLPNKRKEVEQISLIFARWIVLYRGKINHPEPVVNAFAQLANLLQDKASLVILSDLMSKVVEACSLEIKQDKGESDPNRPWRLLHYNRAIVAIRTHDLDIMKQAFDEMLVYLPNEATGFFEEGMKEMDSQEYPAHVRQLMAFYQTQKPPVSWH
jgi:predicted house-cleaning noncanonical NTP pyrophosphatase (MazG superfamily)